MPTRIIPCPQCRKSTTYDGNPHRPFCSERCRQIDLGAWATEAYTIPAGPADTDEESETPHQAEPGESLD